ncbi:sporulation protein YpjB [Ammoniphilus sp. CFH 90114]|uniref:sporulation protein YpjB n=1 Tax=Ammoniphilus sp. CFH 90114 TaxID=2493665 RepID=UPI0013E9157A|nr:sporulation protein YpjB [Ammoniphilus sp. CFH 90114]
MKKKLYLLLITILLMVWCLPALTLGEQEETHKDLLQTLDRLSQEVLSHTEQGQIAEAKAKLDELAQGFTQIGFHKKISIEALELASNSLVQGKQVYAAVSPDKKEALWHATQIRLLIDALTHPNQPIWKGYHMTYLEQVSKMIHHSERKQVNDLSNALQENLKLYMILKPSFAVNHSPSTMQMLDSLYNFLQQQSRLDEVNWLAVQSALEQLREVTGNVFLGKEEFTFAWYISSNSPIAMITLMGLILLSSLSYVGWRMYMGQRVRSI